MQKFKNKTLILMINTAIQNEMAVFLFDGVHFVKETTRGQKDKLLSLIDRVVKKNKKKIADLTGIVVVSGPGPFTAVRQGIVAANALGFALEIPVASVRLDEFKNDNEFLKMGLKKFEKVKMGEIVLPFYGREPNITVAKTQNIPKDAKNC